MTKFYPSHSRYVSNSANYLWLSLVPKKLYYTGPWDSSDQNVGVSTERIGERLMFLAPMELQDNITHNWNPMENILSRIQEKAAQARREIFMATQQHKVDTALIYEDSNRREISFAVNLAVYRDAQRDIFDPIEELRSYSSPNLQGRDKYQTKVGNPDVFSVDTMTGVGKIVPLLNMKNAALTAIQPNYSGPYKNGFPTSCELTLTFKDLEPLSKQTFNVASKVSVG